MELMSPAGNLKSFAAAIEAGADAVYLGYLKFNARRPADNFDVPVLKKLCAEAHRRGKKVYVTLNIDLKDNELAEAAKVVEMLCQINVDALIVKDLGLISLLNRYYKGRIAIHASTQLAITSANGAKLAGKLGFTRAVLADLDGSNSANENDFYGMSTLWWHFDSLYYGSGLRQAEKDPENLFKISDDYFGERAIALSDSIGAWVKSGTVYVDNTRYHKVFCNGNALMSLARHHDIANYLTGDFTHGIAPIPKYNNDQENYITLVGNPISFYSIYALSEDIDRAAAVLECWASEAYRLTSPAVFETTFKLRYSDTSVESQMYDIIRAGIVFDFGRLFNDTLGNMSGQWSWGASQGTSWATASKPYARSLPKKLKDITDSFKAMN